MVRRKQMERLAAEGGLWISVMGLNVYEGKCFLKENDKHASRHMESCEPVLPNIAFFPEGVSGVSEPSC